jgi:hypothetical protein
VNNFVAASLSQLLSQVPVLIVYVIGLILALMFWKRYPLASLLTFLATGILLSLTVALTFVQNYFFLNHELGWSMERIGFVTSCIAFAGGFVRALAFVLLLGAVFVDRNPSRAGPA